MSDSIHAEQHLPSRPRRRWLLRLALALLVGAVAATLTGLLQPKARPTVRTLVRIPLPTPYLPLGGQPLPDLPSHQRTQMALIKSRLVLNSALRDPEVVDLPLIGHLADPLAWLEEEIQVDFTLAPEILRISMSGRETDDLVVLVDAIRRACLREVVDRQRTSRFERRQHLSELIQKYEEQLKAARQTRKALEEPPGDKSSGMRARILAFAQEQLATVEREVLTTQAALRKAEHELKQMQGREVKFDPVQAVDPGEIEAALAEEAEVQALHGEIRRLETNVAQTRKRAVKGDNSPAVLRDRREIEKLKDKVLEVGDRLRSKVMLQLRERARMDLQTRITNQKTRIAGLKGMEETLLHEVDRLRTRVVALSKQGVKLDAFQDDVSHLEEMAKRLRWESEALKVELQAPSRVSVIEEATVTRGKEPWCPFVPALVGLGGFLAAFSCLTLRVRVSLR